MPGNYYLHNKESSYIIKGELLREEEITYNTNRSMHDFLMRHGREVFNMMFDEITYEDIMRIRIEEAEELATKRGMERGIQQGIQKGIQEGIQEGIQQGVPQGIRQASERIALKMKEKDLPLSEISECTGLSEAAIKAL